MSFSGLSKHFWNKYDDVRKKKNVDRNFYFFYDCDDVC